MAEKKWDNLISKIFFIVVVFLIISVLSLITGEDDPVDLIWNSFWAIAYVIGFISIVAWIYVVWNNRKK